MRRTNLGKRSNARVGNGTLRTVNVLSGATRADRLAHLSSKPYFRKPNAYNSFNSCYDGSKDPAMNGMKSLFAVVIAFSCLLLVACQNPQQRRQSERGKPRIAIGAYSVMFYRPPAANVSIMVVADQSSPPGRSVNLRLDDIAFPLDSQQQALLLPLWDAWQGLRQQAISSGQLSASQRIVPLQPTTPIIQLQHQILTSIPQLQTYRDSFRALQAVWHD